MDPGIDHAWKFLLVIRKVKIKFLPGESIPEAKIIPYHCPGPEFRGFMARIQQHKDLKI
jgi:hypothetical protein